MCLCGKLSKLLGLGGVKDRADDESRSLSQVFGKRCVVVLAECRAVSAPRVAKSLPFSAFTVFKWARPKGNKGEEGLLEH